MPRTQFIQDSQLISAADANVQWPSRPQAFLLVETTLSTVGRCYHLSSFSTLRSLVDRAYKDVRSIDWLSTSKLFTIFALGEIHSSRPSPGQNSLAPGLGYFAKASKLMRVAPERPRIDHIELLILFVCLAHDPRLTCFTTNWPVIILISFEQTTLCLQIHWVCDAPRLHYWASPKYSGIPTPRQSCQAASHTNVVDHLHNRPDAWSEIRVPNVPSR